MADKYSELAATKDELAKFYTKPFDKTGARALMVARLERTLKQAKGETVRNKADTDILMLEHDGVAFRPTVNGHPIEFTDFGDEEAFHTTKEKLLKLIPMLIEDVNAGEFDGTLEDLLHEEVSVPVSAPASASKGTSKATSKPKTTRNFGPQSRANIAVAARRRGPSTDDEIRAALIAEGHEAEHVDAALARKKA
jgi:hypothetical protein